MTKIIQPETGGSGASVLSPADVPTSQLLSLLFAKPEFLRLVGVLGRVARAALPKRQENLVESDWFLPAAKKPTGCKRPAKPLFCLTVSGSSRML